MVRIRTSRAGNPNKRGRTLFSEGVRPLSSRGFTLIELLIVLSILALMVVIAVPAISRLGPGAEVKAAAHSVAAALRQGRSQAIRDNAEVAVAFDLENRVLAVGVGPPVQLRRDIALSMLTASSELLGDGVAQIRFYPDGTATGGSVSVARDGVVYDIYVDWLTGRVDFIR